ncbi:YceG family protein [Abyssisolibacter fermentans]|uniref:YceG family protein n=1 Tax=Abyssisolibacter fermentans TaxID=1766203 RepID=UPI0009EA750D|nr:YceG family protein [Abyssisolibacter fermentans]
MINTRKSFKVVITNSNNPFDDLLKPLHQRSGYKSGKLPIFPVLFYRYIGLKNNEAQYINKICELDNKLSNLSCGYKKFVDQIQIKAVNKTLLSKTQIIWNNLSKSDTFSPMNITNSLASVNALPNFTPSLLNESVKSAFEKVLTLYINNEAVINSTKIKNFSLKLLTWVEDYITTLYKNTDSFGMVNPKVLYYGNIKKHEIYFLIFLSQIGSDVLFINSMNDCDFNVIDKNNFYSRKIEFKSKIPVKQLPINKKNNSAVYNVKTTHVNTVKNKPNTKINNVSKNIVPKINLTTADKINSKLKTAHELFDDIFLPLSSRSGFIGGNSPIVPVCFYRYIGIDENVDIFYNKLYRLDKKLTLKASAYIKFDNNISLINNQSLVKQCQSIWTMQGFNPMKVDSLIANLLSCKAFPNVKNKTISNSFINAFKEILDLYLSTESNVNVQKLKNFAMKQLLWLNEYGLKLTKKYDVTNVSGNVINPKVLHYGNIKSHEVYFLMLLAKLGCDVLYINPKDDIGFNSIDPDCKYSYLIESNNKCEAQSFPREEILVRTETTAFKASNELADMIYTESDGIYKPWQFESYETKPLTLKTTIDEVKILWNEEARMRTGFKIENKTVYIPNLFVKISGVYDDLNLYWDDVAIYKNCENTVFYESVPFSSTQYSRADLYKCAYILDNEGFVDKEKLFASNLYKFSYLKTNLQNTIINKINQLFVLPIFMQDITKDFKLKIIMSILSMDKEILNLIQNFDYPFKIPKIMIYDNNESMFNEQDISILAFLNLLGFDILILTPTGYNNIENNIKSKYYDIHKLQKVQFDLQLDNLNTERRLNKQKSFWSSLFGRS